MIDEAPDRFPENMMFLAENGALDHRSVHINLVR
jgi:hypothetical protein